MNTLKQCTEVQELIDAAKKFLEPCDSSRTYDLNLDTLRRKLEVFDKITVLTTWDCDDVIEHLQTPNDNGEALKVTKDQAKQVLEKMVLDYECSPDDWDRITSAYEVLEREDVL
jgi:hypothetical protein